ncbi:hypothetical protein [Gluconobacter frateurii]|uniref:hypothetical protein n=2 Tax=Gluconobacter frateurii TaxID=38308 RepID=UPI0011AFAFA5|nr:hypothetical protein [Gluconobacter frateurii]
MYNFRKKRGGLAEFAEFLRNFPQSFFGHFCTKNPIFPLISLYFIRKIYILSIFYIKVSVIVLLRKMATLVGESKKQAILSYSVAVVFFFRNSAKEVISEI